MLERWREVGHPQNPSPPNTITVVICLSCQLDPIDIRSRPLGTVLPDPRPSRARCPVCHSKSRPSDLNRARRGTYRQLLEIGRCISALDLQITGIFDEIN